MLKINMYQYSTEVNFDVGSYDVFITGGYTVKLTKDFHITIQNIESKEFLKLKFTHRTITYVYNRAVYYLNFVVESKGNYEVLIFNPDKVVIKRSMLTSLNWISSPISNSKKNIVIVNSNLV